MAILKETKDAQASQRAAAALQQKLKDTLIAKLPNKHGDLVQKSDIKNINKLIDSNNYKAARELVVKRNKKAPGANQKFPPITSLRSVAANKLKK
jgi:hypothetical protein